MRFVTPGLLLGIGLGGFADGIVLHQIVQWHNMGSAVVPPNTMDTMKLNMRWDGLFHAATWVITLIGVLMLWSDRRAAAPSARIFIGQMIFGWGLFNLVEGVIDHHVLNLHHVRDLPMHVPVYDWAFLLLGGVLLIVMGAALMAPARRRVAG